MAKSGDARVALIGFPSVGKSSLLSQLTDTKSEAAGYEFTTLTCIPGNLFVKGTRIQLLDLPGIIEGAARGRGRGRPVIAVAKSSDLVLMVLDAAKEGVNNHRAILERELETAGLRLNQEPPDMTLKKRAAGGVHVTATVPLTKLGEDPEETVSAILKEYRMHSAEVLIREDVSADQIIDVIEGNRKYVKCLYMYNKIDMVTIEECDKLAREPHSLVASVQSELNLDRLVAKIWEYLAMRRIYTKRKGEAPDFTEPFVLTTGRHGLTVDSLIDHIHGDFRKDFKCAQVWGTSTIHQPQTVGLGHELQDEDVVQIQLKTVQQQKQDKDYAARVQAHWDSLKEKKKKKLKT